MFARNASMSIQTTVMLHGYACRNKCMYLTGAYGLFSWDICYPVKFRCRPLVASKRVRKRNTLDSFKGGLRSKGQCVCGWVAGWVGVERTKTKFIPGESILILGDLTR